MLEIGPIAFASPWILSALLLLPLLWRLLRVLPPAPRLVRFAPIRFLIALPRTEETPHRTPLWLIALRTAIAALVILALADPLINPRDHLPGTGPVLLVVDDGWAAARDWPARQRTLLERLEGAERDRRPVALITTAPGADGEPVAPSGLGPAAQARPLAQALTPKPWPTDRRATLAAVDALELDSAAHVVWLSDGLDDQASGEAGGAFMVLAERLQRLGSLEVVVDRPERLPVLLRPPARQGGNLAVTALRPTGARATAGQASVWVRAIAVDGRMLGREQMVFAAGEAAATARLPLPPELGNDLARLAIEGQGTAGAVTLIDDRWRRRPVGLVATGPLDRVQPLLSELHYLERALGPFSEVRRGSVGELIKGEIAVLVLGDASLPDATQRQAIARWLEDGGTVLRFAGPNLAEAADELTPVALRRGGRALGGTMSWSRPQRLAPFPRTSPFHRLAAPDEVTVRRQVLAEPSLELAERTWARLADGTPLVTAARRGDGWLVLVHTTANTGWSNLSLSGLFVEMMQRVVWLSQGVTGDDPDAVLAPIETLDGFGRLGAPPSAAAPLAVREFDAAQAGPASPPGFYGRGLERRALNLSPGIEAMAAVEDLPDGVTRGAYKAQDETLLKPWLIAAALLLLLADSVISLALRGLLPVPWGRGAAVAGIVAAVGLAAPGAVAQGADDAAIARATLRTHLAYVITEQPAVDRTSKAGLRGLSLILDQRTAVEPAEPLGVDPARDELSVFPLLYWPMTPQQRPPSPHVVRRLNAYLANGGTILFDTRDEGGTVSDEWLLRRLARDLNVPPLVPVPPDHVLTKAFYLMQEFPGRWAGGTLWVEQPGSRLNDGVSAVIVGGNDWAAAWAIDDAGRPLYAIVPGGELQREMAYRFGVNLVMYALTGNYKADQVHVPAILERLGQ
ncbi:MAG: DUF4159 domain-containing protein [Kiloniellales bacterium]